MHMKAPWVLVKNGGIAQCIESADGKVVVYTIGSSHTKRDEKVDTARRIAACVNACEGLDTVSLRAVADLGGLGERLRVIRGLMDQNAELLAALEACKSHLANSLHLVRVHTPEHHWLAQIATGLDEAKAAIAKAQGGAS